MAPRRPAAFTLVELLVVIALIGMLVGMLMPAIQSARETARRATCSNNIRGLGLALLNFHDKASTFPPSSVWTVTDPAGVRGVPNNWMRENWVITILPYVDEQNLRDSFTLPRPASPTVPPAVTVSDAANEGPRATRLAVMRCPTDAYNDVDFDGTGMGTAKPWARGNYAANAALSFMIDVDPADPQTDSSAYPNSAGWNSQYVRGVMGANCAVSLSQIKDGSSNTILLGEVRAGFLPADPRGVWALGGPSTALWHHGSYGGISANGPNAQTQYGDVVANCSTMMSAASDPNIFLQMGMPCFSYEGPSMAQTSRSMHVGGVFVCFADAHVQFISDLIDVGVNGSGFPAVGATTPGPMSVWDRLNASSDGLVLGSDSY